MLKTYIVGLALVSALACSSPAFAQDSDLAQLREEMKQLRRSYEDRMQALEKRVADAEARAAKAERTATAAPSAPAPSTPASASAFNPAISLVLQGTYARTSQDPNSFAITGFVPSGGEVGPPKRSFGLGESELFITASVDPYFRGALVAALTPENELEVEEAYFQTLSLPRGFTLKGGRFLSGIGYQNEIHQHAWDFQDAPLPYKAFLGGRFQQDGVQLKWIAPTPVFLELGAEIGSGRAFPGNDQNKNGASTYALLAHLGGDIGQSYAWRAGVSHLRTSATNRAFEDVDSLGGLTTNSFTGRSRLWIADAVLKWAPNGNATYTNVKLQAEYFRRKENGSLVYDDSAGSGLFGSVSDSFRTVQSGWYAQGIYQFIPRWRVGYRYDELRRGTSDMGIVNNGLGPTAADFTVLASHKPTRNTLMLDFSPSEFSRLRLQLAQDKSRFGATDNQIILQYIHSLGPHGAHKF
ncbi:MAG TPA: hypothetical protein VFB75_23790 [Burkholderiales bacterium]|nr:hypothetical protein [Burkholderiales bacterium]